MKEWTFKVGLGPKSPAVSSGRAPIRVWDEAPEAERFLQFKLNCVCNSIILVYKV